MTGGYPCPDCGEHVLPFGQGCACPHPGEHCSWCGGRLDGERPSCTCGLTDAECAEIEREEEGRS